MAASSELSPGIQIIDTDTHWSEPHGLWASLAPPQYGDLIPQIKAHHGKRAWVVDGDPC